jgi:hypothetical protein
VADLKIKLSLGEKSSSQIRETLSEARERAEMSAAEGEEWLFLKEDECEGLHDDLAAAEDEREGLEEELEDTAKGRALLEEQVKQLERELNAPSTPGSSRPTTRGSVSRPVSSSSSSSYDSASDVGFSRPGSASSSSSAESESALLEQFRQQSLEIERLKKELADGGGGGDVGGGDSAASAEELQALKSEIARLQNLPPREVRVEVQVPDPRQTEQLQKLLEENSVLEEKALRLDLDLRRANDAATAAAEAAAVANSDAGQTADAEMGQLREENVAVQRMLLDVQQERDAARAASDRLQTEKEELSKNLQEQIERQLAQFQHAMRLSEAASDEDRKAAQAANQVAQVELQAQLQLQLAKVEEEMKARQVERDAELRHRAAEGLEEEKQRQEAAQAEREQELAEEMAAAANLSEEAVRALQKEKRELLAEIRVLKRQNRKILADKKVEIEDLEVRASVLQSQVAKERNRSEAMSESMRIMHAETKAAAEAATRARVAQSGPPVGADPQMLQKLEETKRRLESAHLEAKGKEADLEKVRKLHRQHTEKLEILEQKSRTHQDMVVGDGDGDGDGAEEEKEKETEIETETRQDPVPAPVQGEKEQGEVKNQDGVHVHAAELEAARAAQAEAAAEMARLTALMTTLAEDKAALETQLAHMGISAGGVPVVTGAGVDIAAAAAVTSSSSGGRSGRSNRRGNASRASREPREPRERTRGSRSRRDAKENDAGELAGSETEAESDAASNPSEGGLSRSSRVKKKQKSSSSSKSRSSKSSKSADKEEGDAKKKAQGEAAAKPPKPVVKKKEEVVHVIPLRAGASLEERQLREELEKVSGLGRHVICPRLVICIMCLLSICFYMSHAYIRMYPSCAWLGLFCSLFLFLM